MIGAPGAFKGSLRLAACHHAGSFNTQYDNVVVGLLSDLDLTCAGKHKIFFTDLKGSLCASARWTLRSCPLLEQRETGP